MTWYQFLIPVVLIAVLVRIEAVFVGDYWSWIEMFPDVLDEGTATRKQRRKSLWRRVAIPGMVMFGFASIWQDVFDETAGAVIGFGAACLLLWPLVFHGLPWGVRATDWTVPTLYGAFVVAFMSSAWVGSHIAQWGSQQVGGVGEVLRENLISLIIGAVIVGGATTTWDVASTKTSTLRQRRRQDL